MSMDSMVKAMKTKVGNPLRKLVLIKLADNANDQGECWPSYQHIADQCEIGRSTVKLHIRELEKAGFLRREYRRKGELNQSNLFHLSLDGGAASALWGGAGDNPPGAGDNPPGAGDNPGGGAGAAPRTSHSSEPVNEPKPMSNGFDQFWKLYPRKVDKAKAQKAWDKLSMTPDLFAVITVALARQSTSIDWLKSGGQFIPHPTTWLNGSRWEDEIIVGAHQPSRHNNLNQIDHEAGLVRQEDGSYRVGSSQ